MNSATKCGSSDKDYDLKFETCAGGRQDVAQENATKQRWTNWRLVAAEKRWDLSEIHPAVSVPIAALTIPSLDKLVLPRMNREMGMHEGHICL